MDAFATKITRGYIAVTVFALHRGAPLFNPVRRNTWALPAGMPVGRRTATYFRVQERTDVHPKDAPIPRFVMMGSVVRVHLVHQ